MALNLSAITKPVNPQIVDPSTGRMREEWILYFQQLTTQLNAAVGGLGVDFAPADSEFIVGSASASLTAERVATDTTTVDADMGTAGQAKWNVLEVPGIAATGLVARTAAATYTARTLAGPAAGISVSNGSGVSGNPTLALANDLAALEALASTGIARRTGSDAWSVGSTVDTAEITNDAVTYAKIQNISASARILGRKTGGAGDAEECTLSEVLDFIGSATQGDILYRGASAWARLGAGTSGQRLATGGAGANPAWANAGTVLLSSGTMSGASTLDLLLTSHTAYRGIILYFDVQVSSDGASLYLRFSTNGGSSYDASGYNYARWAVTDVSGTGAGASGSAGQIEISSTIGNQANEGINGRIEIWKQTSTAIWSRATFHTYKITSDATPAGVTDMGGGAREAAQDTDAIRLLPSAGTISGSFGLYGLY